ncbi:hypothetical protein [Pseudomonas putida]|uniref:Uncharacterized protein n=1 Tax=Pseudomonas putida TaxID=303 RepID=A0A6I6XR71_PSEPU|nr:hypothetical protein [Pseudomonas putida]QHG63927.1 hypothetical protein C2H86_05610 [Pseudomonas putida]
MPRMTMQEYRTYLEIGARTLGWGALLIYDRFKANRLLAQEYVEGLTNDKWMPLINFVHEKDNLRTEVANVLLDKPLLSFVNSNIGASKARLSMNVIGGLIIQHRRDAGASEWKVVNYSRLDKLTAPTVRMDIMLNASVEGAVDKEGRVTLDLSQGSAYTFEVSSWKELNSNLGEAIKSEFESWEEADRVWHLNTIKPVEGELNPTKFAVRTHSLARSKAPEASEEEKEEGAVIVGVAFGKEVGTFPADDSHMPYLLPIPERATDPAYSMNLIYSNALWFKDVFSPLVNDMAVFGSPKLVKNSYGLYSGIEATKDFTVKGKFDQNPQDFGTFKVMLFEWPDLHFKSTFSAKHEGEKLVISWAVEADSGKIAVTFYGNPIAPTIKADGTYRVAAKGGMEFQLASDASRIGEVDVVPMPMKIDYTCVLTANQDPDYYSPMIEKAAQHYVMPSIKAAVEANVAKLTGLTRIPAPFNLLRLNGLLFRGTDIATPRTLALPGDFSLLGDLAPRLTTFAVEPLEATVSADSNQTVKFELNPPATDPDAVTWNVYPLKGESAEVGTIKNGVYTPPGAETIAGTFKRVIVKATANGNTSSALVTVVPSQVSVFPDLMIANYKLPEDKRNPRYVLVGGQINNELNWSMVSGAKGSIRPYIEDDEGDDDDEHDGDLDIPGGKNVRIYVAPPAMPGETGEISAVIHLDRVQVSSGAMTRYIEVIIPWATATGILGATSLADGRVQLTLSYYNAELGKEVIVSPKDAKWGVLSGDGEIDRSTGVYKPGAAEGDYIIVASRFTLAGVYVIWGYSVILLSDAAKALPPLNTATARVNDHDQ